MTQRIRSSARAGWSSTAGSPSTGSGARALLVPLLATLVLAAPVAAQDDDASGVDPRAEAGADAREPRAQVTVQMAPTEITVGDRVTATVRLSWPAGAPDVDPRFPAWQETWGKAEVLSVGSVQRAKSPTGDTVFTQELALTAFEVGEITLPSRTLALPLGEVTREVTTPDDLVLTVVSVLAGAEGDDAAPPEPLPAAAPEGLPVGQRFAWTAGALALLCALAAWRAVTREPMTAAVARRRTPRLPPLDELRQALTRIDVERSDAAHTTLSLALRTFVGRTTGVPAVERTTTEIGRLLRDSHLEPTWCRRLLTLLRRCDEAKFVPGAAVTPATTGERAREAEAVAVALDEDLRRRREAEAQAAASGAAKQERAA